MYSLTGDVCFLSALIKEEMCKELCVSVQKKAFSSNSQEADREPS